MARLPSTPRQRMVSLVGGPYDGAVDSIKRQQSGVTYLPRKPGLLRSVYLHAGYKDHHQRDVFLYSAEASQESGRGLSAKKSRKEDNSENEDCSGS